MQRQVNQRGKKNHQDTIRDMIAARYHKGHDSSIITRAFFNLQRNVPNGYIAVGLLLFVQEQIKGIIIMVLLGTPNPPVSYDLWKHMSTQALSCWFHVL